MSKRIAPTLQQYVDGLPDGGAYDACRGELIALLAVARAANRLQAAGGAWDVEGKLTLLNALSHLYNTGSETT